MQERTAFFLKKVFILLHNGLEGYFFGGGGLMVGYGLLGRGFELTEYGDIDIVIEAGIGFESGFGGSVAFDNGEIMVEETKFPFEGFGRMSVLKSMGLALGLLDEFAVCYAGC